jgi:hypothetical protein
MELRFSGVMVLTVLGCSCGSPSAPLPPEPPPPRDQRLEGGAVPSAGALQQGQGRFRHPGIADSRCASPFGDMTSGDIGAGADSGL